MKIEFCIDSVDGATAAKKYGASRVELCSALNVAGLTPSYGLIQQCAHQGVEIHVMIRHIEGGFVYEDDDIEIMQNDITAAKNAGAKGVVFGCLTDDNTIDIPQNKRLIELAQELDLATTFHRAFDCCENPFIALEQIIELGFNRILTSGLQDTAIDGRDLITALVSKAEGRIEIMAGSGVNQSNAITLSEAGVDALHFTIHQKPDNEESLGMGNRTTIDEEKIKGILKELSF